MRKVIIIGAGGHGKVVADIVYKCGDRIVGFLDDNTHLPDRFIGLPILGTTDRYREYMDDTEFFIAVGDGNVREAIAEKLLGVRWYTAIQPTAVISDIGTNRRQKPSIGEGTVIMANAVINSDSIVGRQCIVNTGAIIEHDSVIEDFTHISVGTRIAGTVHIGRRSWIGIGASVSNNIYICDNCIVGAGAVVVRNIEESGTYIGIPAKRRDVE